MTQTAGLHICFYTIATTVDFYVKTGVSLQTFKMYGGHTVARQSRKSTGVRGSKQCPIIGVWVSNSGPSLVSKGERVHHRWCQWEEYCPFIGVNRRNYALSLVSLGGIMPQRPDKKKQRAASAPEATVWRPLL